MFENNIQELATALREKKDHDCCVCINVFTKCKEEKDPCKKKDHDDKECCVCLNVFTKCEEDGTWKQAAGPAYSDRPQEKKECCVCINVFTECETK